MCKTYNQTNFSIGNISFTKQKHGSTLPTFPMPTKPKKHINQTFQRLSIAWESPASQTYGKVGFTDKQTWISETNLVKHTIKHIVL